MSNTRITTSNGRFWNHPILMSVIQLDEKLASKFGYYRHKKRGEITGKSSARLRSVPQTPNLRPVQEKALTFELGSLQE